MGAMETSSDAEISPQDEFGLAIFSEYRLLGGEQILEFRKKEFSIVSAQRTLDLSLYFPDYLHSYDDQRAKVIHAAASSLIEGYPGENFGNFANDLLPCVRERFYFDTYCLKQRLETGVDVQPPFPGIPVTEFHTAYVVLDNASTIKFLTNEMLASKGKKMGEAFSIAVKNLTKISSSPLTKIEPGVFRATWSDGYGPCRLLLKGLFTSLPVKGAPVVAIPNRDTVFATGSEELEGHSGFFERVVEALDNHRCLTPHLLTWKDERWITWIPPEESPRYNDLMGLRNASLRDNYNAQQQILEDIFRKEKNSIYPATYTAVRNSVNDRAMSYCVWRRGHQILLPKTDFIMFSEGENPEQQRTICMAAWDEVVESVGHLMQVQPNLFPKRFHVDAFPNIETLQKLDVRFR